MAEKYANVLTSDGTITTLAAPIATTTATAITTQAAAPPDLQDGEFRARIDNELMLVTGGQDTTTWTVQRGTEDTTPATHATAAKIRHVLTRGSLLAQTGYQIITGPEDPDPDPADYTEPMFWDQLL